MATTKRFSVALDVKRAVSNREIEVVEGDNGNIIDVTLTDDGQAVDLTDCRVIAVFSKSNGTSSQDSDAENGGVSVNGNLVSIALFLPSFAPGMVECELQVYSGTQRKTLVTSAKFNFKCRRGILNEDTVQATSEYPQLIKLIDQCGALQESFDNFSEAEQGRAGSESARTSAESLRVSAEQARSNAENARAASEASRNAAEAARQSLYGAMQSDYISGAFDARVALGTVQTGGAGTAVEIINTGTAGNAVLNFKIPRGDKGDTGDNSAPHAAQHAMGGGDPVTPAAIGAAPASHSHTDAAQIPNLPWSKITSGKPATLSGYGITDAATTAQMTAANTNITALQNNERVLQTSGTAPNYTASDATITSLTDGLKRTILFHAQGTNATLNINGFGAKAIYEYSGKLFSPKSTQFARLYYSVGSNCFFVISPGGGVEFPATIAAGDTPLYLHTEYKGQGSPYGMVTEFGGGYAVKIKKAGVYRFVYNCQGNFSGDYYNNVRLRKNGVDVENSKTGSGTIKTIDVSCAANDKIEVCSYRDSWPENSYYGYAYIYFFAVKFLAADIQNNYGETVSIWG